MDAFQVGAFFGHFAMSLVIGYVIIGLCWIVPKIRRDLPHVAFIVGCVFVVLVALVPYGGPDALGLVAGALAIGFFIWRYNALKGSRLKASASKNPKAA